MTYDWSSDADVGCYELDPTVRPDQARLAVFRNYLAQEYSGHFIPELGAQEILDMVREFVRQGRRLDVGSGTASLFWILSASRNVMTTAADVEPEALIVLREFLEAPAPLPPCYYEAAALFGVSAERVDVLRRSIDSYLVFNALRTWPATVTRSSYDSVTAFGCFGIAGSQAGYRHCFENAAAAVREGGHIVGADWIRHPARQERDYSFINVTTLRAIASDLGLRILHLSDITIEGDQVYGGIVLWAFEAP
jgi:hypothetical protein